MNTHRFTVQVEESKASPWELRVRNFGVDVQTTDPPTLSPAISWTDGSTARSDVMAVRTYLQRIFLLRYEHISADSMGDYNPRVDVSHVRPFATYLKWQATRDHDLGLKLANSLGVHPVHPFELKYVFQSRLNRMLNDVSVDPEYVKRRLLDLDNIWSWVYGYNRMARYAQWPELARQLLEDEAQFHKIFPGPVIYADPDRGIHRSNTKARVRIGMMLLQSRYFKKIISPDDYRLSKTGKRLNRMFHGEQKMIKMKEMEQERAAIERSVLTRIKDWMKGKRDKLVLRYKYGKYV
ncbi:MAG: hypothetical protein L6R39_003210 [Caloplaca ligustica]|nr:MAG: hypothetical protein L6R39_003210 [Caloplaca ligustica]